MDRKQEWGVSLITAGVGVFSVFTFVFFLARYPAQMLAGVNDAFLGATKIFSVPLMLFTFVTTVLAFYLAFGKYGSIRLGEGKPEYSNFSYITMMALAALASAAVYWSFTEWAAYYEAPGIHLEPYSVEALEASLGYSFFHWGFATQGPYVLAGVAVAYAVYNKEVYENGKEITVTLDCTSDMDAVNSGTGRLFGEELAEGLNKALAQSSIKSGNDKLADVAEFKYENGVMKLSEKNGKTTNLVIRSSSSALKALGYDSEGKDESNGISLEKLGENQKLFKDTYASSENMVDFLKGKKLSFSFGGQTKEIELVKSGESFASLDELQQTMQKRLDQAFGTDNIKVENQNGSLEFDLGPAASQNQTLTITSGDADVRKTLGIQKGASNKLSAESSIRDNIDKLLPDATDEEKKAFLEDLNQNGLIINGVRIKGVTADTSINGMIEKINSTEDAGVKASYLSSSNQFVLVTSETGKGREITLDGASKAIFGARTDSGEFVDSSFKQTDTNKVTEGSLEAGRNAEVLVSYGNGIKTLVESSSNTFDLDGMKVTVSGVFGDVRQEDGSWTSDTSMAVTFSASADVDGVTEAVKKFFEEYNAMVTEVNKQITTRPDSSYGPLTDAQKAEMTETSIENWEKKAKEGLLFNDSTMRSLSTDLQSVMTQMLNSGISYQDLEEMGITMSDDYLDGGTITFNEAKFRAAMTSDPDKVSNVFTGGGSVTKGFTNIVEDTLTTYATRYRSQNGNSYGRLIEEAGSEKIPLSVMNNQIYRQLKDMEEVLNKYKSQLSTEQDRYIKQFTSMETLINQMNSQSSYLSQL